MEKTYKAQSGYPIMFLGLLLMCTIGAVFTKSTFEVIGGIVGFIAGCLLLAGLFIVEPGQSFAFILFGEYKGSSRNSGFFWANPFITRKKVSLRAQNLNGAHLKVNDLHGNPIEIAAVVVWQVKDNAQAIFAVEDYKNFVSVQSEAAVRHMANSYPYDQGEEVTDQLTLRDGGDLVAARLVQELNERLAQAGIEVTEARLSHLAYAPEIASAMLQRQQAAAIVAARRLIVDGAVGMVEMALARLSENNTVELDEERKAAMVSNLLVVLCSERSVSPVVNAGTLHH